MNGCHQKETLLGLDIDGTLTGDRKALDQLDLPGFIGPMISRKWRAPGSLLRLFERTVPA